MNEEKKFEELQNENNKLRKDLFDFLNQFLMSGDVDTAEEKINLLIENEIQQERLCEQ